MFQSVASSRQRKFRIKIPRWLGYVLGCGLVQESARYEPNCDRTKAFRLRLVHKPERESCNVKERDTDWQQFAEEKFKSAPEILSSFIEVPVVFRHEHDDSIQHDPFASNARRPLHVAERSECDEERFDYFQAAKLAKRWKAVCKEIEKEIEVNGISLKTLRRRLVYCYSNRYYSLM